MEATLGELRQLGESIAAEIPGVRKDYSTLDLGRRLMARTNTPSIECAVREEARQRVLRRQWAAVSARQEAA